ncbi:MAG: precorrin-8X methylmutase, partial [Pseudomonadota bacterium]
MNAPDRPWHYFDTVMVIDWSAAATPRQGKDSIWIALARPGEDVTAENPATRADAMARVAEVLDAANAGGERVLAGFDFAFGYPSRFARAFGENATWRDVWAAIAKAVEEGPANRNNRFHAAAALNDRFPGDGPFYTNGLREDIAGLTR